MFKVYWTNFGYFAADEFETYDAAIKYGKSKCFEFQIYNPAGNMIAVWSQFSGLKEY